MDDFYMNRALQLAYRGIFTTDPNPNVGCVIVKNNHIVGEGWHRKAGDMHAEIYALINAGKNSLNATAYITLEPCNHFGKTPPCCIELIKSGINRVVIATKDPNPLVSGKSLTYLQKHGIQTKVGTMANEAKKINCGFFKRMKTGFPWIQIKMASSIDGRTSLLSEKKCWITDSFSRSDVQKFRAQSSAILSSSATVMIDNPSLNVRWNELDTNTKVILKKEDVRQPIIIIIDSKNKVTSQYKIINQSSNNIWFIRKNIKREFLSLKKIKQILVPTKNENIDLLKMFLILGKKQINKILVESGPKLAGALIKQKLADEIILYMSPKIFGHENKELFYIPKLHKLSEALEYKFTDIQVLGNDLRLILTPKKNI
ncbi:bifunctional pyrimidine deaminase/reductase in pathway of riboflavin synthesis [Candidatus Tachikawaea gelatinosa]|uniref:Riboflavin biosynthesis protein RibD n=2 Tax=Candidatus Tachikawaea gelatinosa TaxID=1410383 RepID=A0A090AJW8_9ENTR|nr:bifunctional pyrimidine deaminase/reductase in pathway of riboflavin synthesis [Candidatus Tachikawaea gelatinosa]